MKIAFPCRAHESVSYINELKQQRLKRQTGTRIYLKLNKLNYISSSTSCQNPWSKHRLGRYSSSKFIRLVVEVGGVVVVVVVFTVVKSDNSKETLQDNHLQQVLMIVDS